MITIPFAAGEANLDWLALMDAITAAHDLSRAQLSDTFLYEGDRTLLNRAAWIKGLGLAVKTVTVFPDNAPKPIVGGAVNLFSDADGTLEAVLDFQLVTKWKTAADSVLAARRLAHPGARDILIIGAGAVAKSLYQAYFAAFPTAQFTVWNRSGAAAFQAEYPRVSIATDLQAAVAAADIVTCATMSTEPLIKGDWLRPGQHIDLVGAYRPDMREADDAALSRARIFVDNYDTTLAHIGELKIPLDAGVIGAAGIIADFYDLDTFVRSDPREITLFKNGGGAHLDLMTSRYILSVWPK